MQGLAIAYPPDAPGVEDWVYQYGLLDELAINAYWTGRYKECADACDRLLSEGKLPAEKRDRVQKNKQFAIDNLAAVKPLPTNASGVEAGTSTGPEYRVFYILSISQIQTIRRPVCNFRLCIIWQSDRHCR